MYINLLYIFSPLKKICILYIDATSDVRRALNKDS
ncbi:hypothetical protein FRAHR75_170003 [Frankia sp. Hr75.2]|nr:hypothetical protein FRAHR75_170003 [Frankia sp. Hr75.2]SQD96901.1 hypothetical protein FMEAI12_3810006 [Parafrankia sp. Ea1.12]